MIQLRKIENESPWVISQLANNYEFVISDDKPFVVILKNKLL